VPSLSLSLSLSLSRNSVTNPQALSAACIVWRKKRRLRNSRCPDAVVVVVVRCQQCGSPVAAPRRSKSKEIFPPVLSCTLCTRARVRAVSASIRAYISARRTRRATGVVAGFRQSNDNDRNMDGNRLHAVKSATKGTRNTEEEFSLV